MRGLDRCGIGLVVQRVSAAPRIAGAGTGEGLRGGLGRCESFIILPSSLNETSVSSILIVMRGAMRPLVSRSVLPWPWAGRIFRGSWCAQPFPSYGRQPCATPAWRCGGARRPRSSKRAGPRIVLLWISCLVGGEGLGVVSSGIALDPHLCPNRNRCMQFVRGMGPRLSECLVLPLPLLP